MIEHLHNVGWACPSLHLKESLKGAFFFGLELSDFLFSSVEEVVPARQGKQLLGRRPQLCNIPRSPLAFSSTEWVGISSTTNDIFLSVCRRLGFSWDLVRVALLAVSLLHSMYSFNTVLGCGTGSDVAKDGKLPL